MDWGRNYHPVWSRASLVPSVKFCMWCSHIATSMMITIICSSSSYYCVTIIPNGWCCCYCFRFLFSLSHQSSLTIIIIILFIIVSVSISAVLLLFIFVFCCYYRVLLLLLLLVILSLFVLILKWAGWERTGFDDTQWCIRDAKQPNLKRPFFHARPTKSKSKSK